VNRSEDTFATRVLAADLRLHGRRFVLIEFAVATAFSVSVGMAVAIAAVIRQSGWVGSLIAVGFFAGVAVNARAVTNCVATHSDHKSHPNASLLDLGAFALATLLPGVLELALRP
jgi:hypothetical protein